MERVIYYIGDDGKNYPISIKIGEFIPERRDFDDNTMYSGYSTNVIIRSDFFNRDLHIIGQDELQLLYRCFWISDVWLRATAERAEITLFAINPDFPITEFGGVYK